MSRTTACSASCAQLPDLCTCGRMSQPLPAEAVSEFCPHRVPPLERSLAGYALAPLIERWPRYSLLAGLMALVTLLCIRLPEQPALRALDPLAAAYLPGDGFPPELLAQPLPQEPSASEVQP